MVIDRACGNACRYDVICLYNGLCIAYFLDCWTLLKNLATWHRTTGQSMIEHFFCLNGFSGRMINSLAE